MLIFLLLRKLRETYFNDRVKVKDIGDEPMSILL